MARTFAQVPVGLWSDPSFRLLSSSSQCLYLALRTSPDTPLCGVLDWIPKRWAMLSADGTVDQLAISIAELATAGFVDVDDATDEVMIVGFVVTDKINVKPNMRKPALDQAEKIVSDRLRAATLEALKSGVSGSPETVPETVSETVQTTVSETVSQTHPPTDLQIYRSTEGGGGDIQQRGGKPPPFPVIQTDHQAADALCEVLRVELRRHGGNPPTSGEAKRRWAVDMARFVGSSGAELADIEAAIRWATAHVRWSRVDDLLAGG